MNKNDFDVTLLSKEEYQQCMKRLPQVDGWWWLCSPGYDFCHVAGVFGDGTLDEDGRGITNPMGAVRPAFRLKKGTFDGSGGKVRIGDLLCTVINPELALSDTNLCLRRFDLESNEWESSELYRWLHSEACVNMIWHKYLSKKETDVLDRLDWNVIGYTDDGRVELTKYSPAGEDFGICVDVEDFPTKIRKEANEFDVDEHVELWIDGRGTRGVPNSVRELLEDAEAIKEMLFELADALEDKPKTREDHERDDCKELLRLIKENPDLPVIPMVSNEVVPDDTFHWWLGKWGSASVDAYLVADERVWIKSWDDDEDVLEAYLGSDAFSEISTEEDLEREIQSLPWIPAIIVRIYE